MQGKHGRGTVRVSEIERWLDQETDHVLPGVGREGGGLAGGGFLRSWPPQLPPPAPPGR